MKKGKHFMSCTEGHIRMYPKYTTKRHNDLGVGDYVTTISKQRCSPLSFSVLLLLSDVAFSCSSDTPTIFSLTVTLSLSVYFAWLTFCAFFLPPLTFSSFSPCFSLNLPLLQNVSSVCFLVSFFCNFLPFAYPVPLLSN